MITKKGNFLRSIAAGLLATFLVAPAAQADTPTNAGSQITVSPVFWTWGDATDGTTRLVRRDSGLSATYQAVDLPPGQVVTLWFIVFNNPGACASSPCGPSDIFNNDPDGPAGDFLWGGGTIVGGTGKANLGGHLSVGDTSGSGLLEIGMPEYLAGLTDPWNAEVHLMIHSHGPAQTGTSLKSQLNSFTGGCYLGFLGNVYGAAESSDDIPSLEGECSTLQGSMHQ